jgi:hypothetical protein
LTGSQEVRGSIPLISTDNIGKLMQNPVNLMFTGFVFLLIVQLSPPECNFVKAYSVDFSVIHYLHRFNHYCIGLQHFAN